MASSVETYRRAQVASPAQTGSATEAAAQITPPWAEPVEKDKVLPLPGWLVKVYFIFPVVLYVPDAIFNYYVYSHGITSPDTSLVVQVAFVGLWGFLSVGVVGMAYLLSVLAPWHWGQGHHIQAFFCGLGVLVATGITTWNSLAYRSQEQQAFAVFKTDQWAYSIWPQLQANNISLTMILVAVAPPFWGLFWAIVQPTQSGRSLRQLQESHAERLLRLQQESELKRVKAETNAKIREAQLRGMAHTAAAARAQAKALLAQGRAEQENVEQPDHQSSEPTSETASPSGETLADIAASPAGGEPASILRMPAFAPASGRETANSRGSAVFMNHAAATIPTVHSAPANPGRMPAAQAQLMGEPDVQGPDGRSGADAIVFTPRRSATLGSTNPDILQVEAAEDVGMTGTTGPRPAIRRPEPGSLIRQMNELPPHYAQALDAALTELNISRTKRTLTQKETRELAARLTEKMNGNETMAKAIISRWQKSRESQRGSRA